jgi:hypothetical protein
MNDWLEEILSKPTTSIENAGKALGYGKNKSHEAAKRGDIFTIDIGTKRKTVPTAWLRRKLQLDGTA